MSAPGFVLIGGGARSGKTSFALRLAMQQGSRAGEPGARDARVFVATAEALDDEMRERIRRHVIERGDAFTTIEAPLDLDDRIARLARDDARDSQVAVVVIDCLTLWLSNLLLADLSQEAIEARVEGLAATLASAPFRTLLVTNEVGMGVVPESALGRAFRDVSGRAHQRLARSAREIYLATLGTILRLRPAPLALVEESGDE